MKKDLRFTVLGAALMFALCMSALASHPALADDGAPPPDSAPTEPATDSSSANVASSTEVSPTDVAPSDVALPDAAPTDTVPTDVAPTDVAPTDVAPVDAMATDVPADAVPVMPSGTDLVVVNAAGTNVPLGTGEAAAIVATGDPMWCPNGASPRGGVGGCSPSFNTFNDPGTLAIDSLIEWLHANPKTTNGTIWVLQGLSSDTAPITLDGSTFGTTANFVLTVNGGWNGTAGSTTIVQSNPSTFNHSFTITGWVGDVTLNDIVVSGAASDGLTVTTRGKITLNRVKSNGNAGRGANLTNSGGTGAVLITSSAFNGNTTGDGLDVSSRGTITLTSVIASLNGGMGASLNNSTAATAQAVTLTGANSWNSSTGYWDNSFSDNYDTGLQVTTGGIVTLTNLTANANGHLTGGTYFGDGAFIDNTPGTAVSNVVATGFNVFNGNFRGGLSITSDGMVTLNGLMANSNQHGYGVYVNNSTAATTTQNVTLTGTNVFKYNYDTNLYLVSSGIITTNNVTANNSVIGNGASLTNIASSPAVPRSVTLNGTNAFNGNGGSGVDVLSYGAITLANITANGNAEYGAFVDFFFDAITPQNISFTGNNTFIDNDNTGLLVSSYGTITTNNVTAKNNGGYGAEIHNNVSSFGSPILIGTGNVTMNGSNIFQNNFDSGLEVLSNGSITVGNLQASGNGTSGATSDHGVVLINSGSNGTPGVSVNGTNVISSNQFDGLVVNSKGTINAANLTASDNGQIGDGSGGFGVVLDNTYGTASGSSAAVTLSGIATFNNNYLSGLKIKSEGGITISATTLTANNNGLGQNDASGGWGVSLDNTGASTTAKNVSLGGKSTYNGNYSGGLTVLSTGSITVANLTASGNDPFSVASDGYGVVLDNTKVAATSNSPGITLSGVNAFSNNYLTGLVVSSYGAITLQSITSSGNGVAAGDGWGALVTNTGASTPKNVTVGGTNVFNGNFDGGLSVTSKGAISTNNVTASNNTRGGGAVLDNFFTGAVGGVSVNGVNAFNTNYLDGLNVLSVGAITASSLTAGGNGTVGDGSFGYGAILNNTPVAASLSSPNVTVSGVNVLNNNYLTGLSVKTYGTASLSTSSLTANGNGLPVAPHGWGVSVDNSTALAPRNVTVGGTNTFNGNYLGGLSVISKGAITTNNVTAGNNTSGNGATLNNHFTGAVGAVAVNGTNSFNHNFNDGLAVTSLGAISGNNLSAGSNVNGNGATLANNFTGSVGPVTLTGTNTFLVNGADGLNIASNSNVTLSKITADGNTGDGLHVSAAPGTLRLTCGSFTNNTDDGLDWTANSALLIGVFASGNDGTQITGTPTMSGRPCTLP